MKLQEEDKCTLCLSQEAVSQKDLSDRKEQRII